MGRTGAWQAALGVSLAAAAWSAPRAAELPPHPALRILIVSDEVNPHGLSDPDLTQPGDISATLSGGATGLNLDGAADAVVEIATNDIEQATALLAVPRSDPAAYDVLIYFAHRIPDDGNDPPGRQAAFTAAVEAFLEAGGGVVSFHHGAYLTAGKEDILDLIGASASGRVPWDTVSGQNVIATAPQHFVACYGEDYTGSVAYADAARGVAPGVYPAFNNTPDERYPFFEYNPSAAGNVLTLFGSDYADNGTTHLLGFVHRRPEWQGAVVAYQPGEYQPNALDDVGGPDFQILANAIVFAAGVLPDDAIVLRVARGPAPGDVHLEWHACDATFSVRRSPDPATASAPGSEIAETAAKSWDDPATAGSLLYYLVLAP